MIYLDVILSSHTEDERAHDDRATHQHSDRRHLAEKRPGPGRDGERFRFNELT